MPFKCDLGGDHRSLPEAQMCMQARGSWWTVLEIEGRLGAGAYAMSHHPQIRFEGMQPEDLEHQHREMLAFVKELDRPFVMMAKRMLRSAEGRIPVELASLS